MLKTRINDDACFPQDITNAELVLVKIATDAVRFKNYVIHERDTSEPEREREQTIGFSELPSVRHTLDDEQEGG